MQLNSHWAMLCAAAVVLPACTTLDTSQPNQMYRQAIIKNLKQDNQYNFSGEMTLAWQDKTPPIQASEPIIQDEVIDADSVSEPSDTQWQSLQRQPVIESLMKHSTIKLDGAVDLRKAQIEVTPALYMGTANYGAWAQLPMHIDAKNERILVDVQGYAGWAPIFNDEMMPIKTSEAWHQLEKGALLELSAPKDGSQKYPIQSLLKAVPQGLEAYFDAMAQEQFVLAPMDDYGRSLQAAYRVQLDYKIESASKWSAAFLKAYHAEFERLHQEQPETGVNEEAYEQSKGVILLGAMLLNQATEASECDVEEHGATVCEEIQDELKALQAQIPKMQQSLYLSRQGRVLGMHDEMVLQYPQTRPLVMQSKIKFYNYGRPQFKMHIDNRPTVSIWRVLEQPTQDNDALLP